MGPHRRPRPAASSLRRSAQPTSGRGAIPMLTACGMVSPESGRFGGAPTREGLSLHWKLTVSTLHCGRFTGRRCTEAEGESRSGAASTPARRAAAWGVSIGAVTAEIGPSPASRRSVGAKTPGVADRPASMNHVVHDLGQHPGGGVLAARLLNSPAFSVPMLGRRATGHCSRRQRRPARPARRR